MKRATKIGEEGRFGPCLGYCSMRRVRLENDFVIESVDKTESFPHSSETGSPPSGCDSIGVHVTNDHQKM